VGFHAVRLRSSSDSIDSFPEYEMLCGFAVQSRLVMIKKEGNVMVVNRKAASVDRMAGR
jgi:hypothetical protein